MTDRRSFVADFQSAYEDKSRVAFARTLARTERLPIPIRQAIYDDVLAWILDTRRETMPSDGYLLELMAEAVHDRDIERMWSLIIVVEAARPMTRSAIYHEAIVTLDRPSIDWAHGVLTAHISPTRLGWWARRVLRFLMGPFYFLTGR